jgi:prevent-host-death family protein
MSSGYALHLEAYADLDDMRPTRLIPVMYNEDMAKHVIDMSEAEATRDFGSLLAQVREGAEVVIKNGTRPVAVVRPAESYVRLLSDSLRLAREHGSTATLDENFARDVAAAVESHGEPLKPPAWD